MEKMIIEGGRPLMGSVSVHGAKNAVLPILAGTLLSEDTCVIHNCPKLKDVFSSLEILRMLGCEVHWKDDSLTVNAANCRNCHIPDALMREMRSSVIFLGAITSRFKRTCISYPGGCELGARPIDLHLKAFRDLGVEIVEEHGFVSCKMERLMPCEIHLSFPSVGATENIMLLTALSEGDTIIRNAAREPEIVDLQRFLNAMGAKIRGAGSSTIYITGVKKLSGTEHSVMPDRIVAVSYLAAGLITGGSVEVTRVCTEDLVPVLSVFRDGGCSVEYGVNSVRVTAEGRIKAVDVIRTMPHPGFPTDAQSPIMSLLSTAEGTSIIAENIFENRFKHVPELIRMGADITIDGKLAVIRGVSGLLGANVMASDLRGAAALVIAGLAARGRTEVAGLWHLDRGYADFEENLRSLGADISRKE